jgi:CRISPR-associated protein Csn2
MRLLFEACNLEIEIREGQLTGICIENSEMFRRLTESLWNQANAMEGEIFLTQGDKALKLTKEGSVIFNPYSIDVNEKKILSHIYSEIQEVVNVDFYVQKNEINSAVVSLLDEAASCLPYPLEYSLELDVIQLLKIYGVKIEMQDTELIERVVNYIRLSHQVLGTVLFVFVHFRNYFSQEELSKLKEMIQYEQISVLMIENMVDLKETVNEKWWIVDQDLCMIEV